MWIIPVEDRILITYGDGARVRGAAPSSPSPGTVFRMPEHEPKVLSIRGLAHAQSGFRVGSGQHTDTTACCEQECTEFLSGRKAH